MINLANKSRSFARRARAPHDRASRDISLVRGRLWFRLGADRGDAFCGRSGYEDALRNFRRIRRNRAVWRRQCAVCCCNLLCVCVSSFRNGYSRRTCAARDLRVRDQCFDVTDDLICKELN